MARRTPLFELHQSLGARLVDFGGWEMPLHYGSQIDEHLAVRRAAGVFDVSHMGIIDVQGEGVRAFLQRLLANDVGRLKQTGTALYSCMLNESGGVLDDLIVYFIAEKWFRLVVNAGTRAPDLAWMRRQSLEFGALEISEREDLAMLAVQGPLARAQVVRLLPADAQAAALSLDPFCAREIAGWFIARTGYTGEDGFEVILPAGAAVRVWRELNALQVASCGLGARDTLRLEAGMNLYGADMDELHNPLESGLGWTVAFAPAGRAFIGRAPLEALKRDGVPRKLVGLVLEERGVLRAHQKVLVPGGGEVTSGTFSPSLERSIGFARVPQATPASVVVEVRGKPLAARIVKPPFIRHGRSLVTEIAD